MPKHVVRPGECLTEFMTGTRWTRVGALLLCLVACLKPATGTAATPAPAALPAPPAQKAPAPKAPPSAPPPAPAEEMVDAQVLIWGGGRTAEEGHKALERFQAEREGLEAILTLGKDYPRVVVSDTLPGLTPGFHVVVLGACTPQQAKEPLQALQAFKAGVYARAVKMALGADSCPKHENNLVSADLVRLTQKPFELTAASFMDAGSPTSSPPAVPWLVRLYLRDASGALVDQKAVDPRHGMWEGTNRNSCFTQPTVEGTSIRVSVECERLAGGPGPSKRTEEFEYRIKAGKIEWVLDP